MKTFAALSNSAVFVVTILLAVSARAACPPGMTIGGDGLKCVQKDASGNIKFSMYQDATPDYNKCKESNGTFVAKKLPEGLTYYECQAGGGGGVKEEMVTGNYQITDPKDLPDAGGVCDSRAKAAMIACDPFSKIAGEDGAFLEMAINQGVNIANQIGNIGKSQHEQCKSAASLAKTMGIVNAGKGVACKVAMNKCESACQAEVEWRDKIIQTSAGAVDSSHIEYRQRAKKRINECKQYQGNFQASIMQALMSAQQYATSAACAEATKAENMAQIAGVAKTIDCNDPNFARTSPTCVCPKNPRDPMCLGQAGQAGAGSMQALGGTKKNGDGSVGSLNGLGDGFDPASAANAKDGQAGKSAANGIPQNGGGGGFGQGGGGANGAMAGADAGAGGKEGLNTNIMQGVGSGGGGGTNFGGYKGGTDGYLKAIKDKFNLKGMFPNKDKAGRGLAGMTVQAADGITGPMGPSIWEKVSTRYQIKKPSLLP